MNNDNKPPARVTVEHCSDKNITNSGLMEAVVVLMRELVSSERLKDAPTGWQERLTHNTTAVHQLYMVSAGRCDGMFAPTNPRK